jgi:oligopeptide/dipeptide ABC transporter ATP-binding protein
VAAVESPPQGRLGPVGNTALRVQDLSIEIKRRRGPASPAVQGVSFAVEKGEILSLVGESGCGKTLTSLAVMRLLPAAARQVSGRVVLGDEDLVALSAREMRLRRGRDISMVFQEPMTALDPSFKVGSQLVEAYLAHESAPRAVARARAVEMLELVGIPDAKRRLDGYPHQFSGGMRQRIMIAMALMLEPQVLIADEPTTALDVTIQAQILDLIRDLRDELGMSVLLITHDLGVVNEVADRVVVMYAGEVVESAPTRELLSRPEHPYTQGLLRSMPSLTPPGHRLSVIPGRVPDVHSIPQGCRFAPRCPNREPRCTESHPSLEHKGNERELRCFNPTPFTD